MRAVRVHKAGGPDVLKIDRDVPIPVPSDTQVLIEVKAAGINPVDTYIRSGNYPMMKPYPYIPGGDAAGIVKKVGSSVKSVKVGERVYVAAFSSGSYAKYLTAEADKVRHLDDKLTFQQGAGIGVPCYTAYKALYLSAGKNMKNGNSVLVHGASGAVGLACVQIAVERGMVVYATAGSQKGLELVKKYGARGVFNHKEKGYAKKIEEATGGKGVDIIVEMVAHVNLQTDLELIARKGFIVIVGNGGTVEINPRHTMGKECIITGVLLGLASKEEWEEMHPGVEAGLKAGWLHPIVGKEYTLEQAPLAHDEIMNAPGTLGKRVFTL